MKRPSFLAHHLKGVNRSIRKEATRQASRFYFLFPCACLSLGLMIGFLWGYEKAYLEYTVPLSGPSEAVPTRSSLTPSHGATLEWRGSARSGETIRQDEQKGLNFVF